MPEVSPDNERFVVPIESSTDTSADLSAVADRDEVGRIRIPTRWGYGGFGFGLALAFVITAAQVANRGYQILPTQLVWNLIWAPFLGANMGFGLSRAHRPGPLSWRRPQLRTRTLMVIIAYVAILFGAGVSTRDLGNAARLYFQNWATADSRAKVAREQGRKSEEDAMLRRANVEGLRAGNIPVGLSRGQREFLRSLEEDPQVTPEQRKYRRDLITDGEERTMSRQEHNVVALQQLVEYYEELAAKYDRAQWRPWLPVEPDPPMPK